MLLIPLEELYIDLDDRSRKQFPTDKSKELLEDILKNGLYHAPIVVRLDPPILATTGQPKSYKLVAGHRRTSAIRRIYDEEETFTYNSEPVPMGLVPVTLAQNDDPVTIKEIELHENIIRLDLGWQERADAIAELHNLRVSQDPTHTKKQTAQEIAGSDGDARRYQRTVSNAIAIHKHRDDPDVANARTEKDALATILRKYEETINRAVERPRIQSSHRLLHGDSLELLTRLPDRSFACLLTDPPYGMDADKFGDAAKLTHRYTDSGQMIPELYETLFREAERFLAEDAHIYIFCDIDNFHLLKSVANDFGFKPWRTPLTWNKGNRGHLPSGTSSGWRRSSEWIFHAVRGARLHTGISNDTIDAEWEEEKIHAAQKPYDLFYKLLKMSCYPGEHVLDPFCGAGPIFRAARKASLKATGIDREEDWIRHIESFMQIEREELIP